MAVEAFPKSGVLTPWPLQTRGRAGSALGGLGSTVGPEARYSASGTQALLSPALPTDVSSSFRASRSGSVSTQVDVVGSDGAASASRWTWGSERAHSWPVSCMPWDGVKVAGLGEVAPWTLSGSLMLLAFDPSAESAVPCTPCPLDAWRPRSSVLPEHCVTSHTQFIVGLI